MSAPVNTVEPIREKPHGPQTTWGRRLLGPLHVTGIAWYRLHYWLTFFPEWFIVMMNWLSTCFFWFWLWNIRAAVASNLEALLGPCGFFERQRRIWRTFYDLAWCLTERYEQFRDRPMRFEYEGRATFAQMQESARGYVFFTAHFGNWEMGPLVREVPRGRKIHVVREPEMNGAAQDFVSELFRNHPHRDLFVVHYAGADLTLGARLLMALRKGDIVALPGDRPRAGMGSLTSRMFGRPMELPPGPAALARAADAHLVPVFVFREGRRQYRIVLREPIAVARTDDKAADIRNAVDQMADACEWAIRQRPHHWFCWKRLW
ncbi:MAG TPA: lysophospholipid acyltransferase family protein [Planctomycetota bacterium]|nr:lysophospholipid acyltransferase family protein [Planctomycetota bacterium]